MLHCHPGRDFEHCFFMYEYRIFPSFTCSNSSFNVAMSFNLCRILATHFIKVCYCDKLQDPFSPFPFVYTRAHSLSLFLVLSLSVSLSLSLSSLSLNLSSPHPLSLTQRYSLFIFFFFQWHLLFIIIIALVSACFRNLI